MFYIFSSNLVSGLLGAFVGAFFSNWLSTRNERVKLTMDLHKEWNSPEMSIQRRLGYHCIKRFPNISYNELTECDEKGSLSVFTVLRFYERLWSCFETNRVDRQLTANLFYKDFYWWYFISFSTSLKAAKDGWPSYYDIEKLKTKFREYTSELDFRNYSAAFSKKYDDYVQNKVDTPAKSEQTTTNSKSFNITGFGDFEIVQNDKKTT